MIKAALIIMALFFIWIVYEALTAPLMDDDYDDYDDYDRDDGQK